MSKESNNWFNFCLAVIPDDSDNAGVERDTSLDSMSSRFTNDSSEQQNSGTIFDHSFSFNGDTII